MNENTIKNKPKTMDEQNGKTKKPVMNIENLKKYYDNNSSLIENLLGSGTNPIRAVDDVSFSLNRGETLGIVGESGCGKSTLARTLVGLHKPTEGNVTIFNNDVHELVQENRKRLTRLIQFVFQDPSSCLDPRLTVRQIVREPLKVHEVGAKEHQMQLVEETIKKVGLSIDQLDRYPSELSGGQRQRVGIARALVLEPEILVLDEPTSALDVSVQAQILNLLKDIQNEFELSMLIISHDISVIRYLSDRVGVMYLGELIEIGNSSEIFNNTAHPYTTTLLDSVPRVGEFNTEYEKVDPDIPSPRNPPTGCRFHTRCVKNIPPTEYDINQDEWNAILTYKYDLKNNNISMSKIRNLTSESLSEKNIKNNMELLYEYYDIPQNSLDSSARNKIESSFDCLIDEDIQSAFTIMDESFKSVCEKESPQQVEVDSDHRAMCHLLTD